MAYSAKTKESIRSDYIRGLTLKGAAEKSVVPYDTVRSWKRSAKLQGDNWDTAKAAARISSGGIKTLTSQVIEDFVHLFQSTIEEIKAAKDIDPLKKAEAISRLSDAYQKTIKAAGASNPELARLAIAMDVLQRMSEFIRRNHPEMKQSLLTIIEPFGKELSRVYG